MTDEQTELSSIPDDVFLELAAAQAEEDGAGSVAVRLRAIAAKLKPAAGPVFCKNCPFAQHVHSDDGTGRLMAPGCSGFAPLDDPQRR